MGTQMTKLLGCDECPKANTGHCIRTTGYSVCLEKKVKAQAKRLQEAKILFDEVVKTIPHACLCINHGQGGGINCKTCVARGAVDKYKVWRGE